MGQCSSSIYLELDYASDRLIDIEQKVSDRQIIDRVILALSPNDWDYRNKLIFYGYIRRNAVDTIIHDVMRIIFTYFHPIYVFPIIKGHQPLSQSTDSKQQHRIRLYQKKIDDIMDIMFYISTDHKRIVFRLKIPQNKLSDDQQIIIYTELRCESMQFYAKDVTKFDAKKQQRCYFNICFMKNWLQFEHREIMEFKAHFKVIDAKNIESVKTPPVILSETVEYEWNIDDKLLYLFKNAEVNTSFYSNSFDLNEMWCLKCIPCNVAAKCIVGLGLIKLPLRIHSINVHVKLYVNNKLFWGSYDRGGVTFNHEYKWSYDGQGTSGYIAAMLNSKLYKLKQLSFKIEIIINSVFAYDDQGKAIAVPACHWKDRYNIQ